MIQMGRLLIFLIGAWLVSHVSWQWVFFVPGVVISIMAVLTYRVKQSVAPRGSDGMGKMQEMVDSSTWVRKEDQWQCVAHTETPLEQPAQQRHH